MSTSEKASLKSRITSVVDLFATPLTASHYVELVNPLWSSHRLQARVEEVWDETKDARTITLRPGRNWRAHRAGQHIRLGVPIGGMHYTRTYSISSTPERRDGCITVTVKVLDGGRMSSHLVRSLKTGAFLPIGLPQGDFLLPEAMPVSPLFITAGSGITPVMSMLRTYASVGNIPDVVHIHYAPHPYDVIFGNELRELADRYEGLYHYRPVYTRELGPSPRSNGSEDGSSRDRHFSATQLDELCPDWMTRDVWACGPQSLLDTVASHFAAAGRARHFHIERFRAPLADVGPDAVGGTVTFNHAGRTVVAEADGATPLLRVAEDAGLNPPHGCRMGICRTCDIPLISGQVRDLRTGMVHGEAGQRVQTCINAAAGPCQLEF